MATQIHGAGPTGQRSPGLDLAIAGYLAENPPAGGGGGASTLNDLTDVDTSGQTTGDVLKYNGTTWVADAASAGTVTSTDISDSTATGRAVLTAADAATARAAIGAGTSSFDGAYSSLSGTPTLGTAAAANTGDFATAAQGALADTATQPGDLATVATTGDYDDLTGKPTIPAAGIPAGGTDGQVLTKTSGTDYASAWETPSGGSSSGVSVAKFRTSGGTTYPQFLPGHLGVLRDVGESVSTTSIYLPFTAHGEWQPTEFHINVLTAASAGTVLYVWLYAADEDFQPEGTPVLDVTASGGFPLDSTGVKSISGFTATIPAGNYIAITRASAGGATLRAYGLAALAPSTSLGAQFFNRPELTGVTDTTAPASGPKWAAGTNSNNGITTYLFWK